MTSIVTEIVEILTSGISGIATGIGGGLKSLVESIFVTMPEGGSGTAKLSTFGGVIIVFAAIGLAIGLSRFVVNWVTSLGN